MRALIPAIVIPFVFVAFVFAESRRESKEPKETKEQIVLGGKVFKTNCIACHGENGDGKGPAAVAIKDPKPRDFTKGEFKFGSEPKEIYKTISEGSPGTAMPGWGSLSPQERWALVYYVRSIKKADK